MALDEGTDTMPGAGGPARADRLDAMLEERFRAADRQGMAREIAQHDQRWGGGFDREHVRRKVIFHGDLPAKVRQGLTEWLLGMLEFAAGQGLRLRDLNHEVHFYDPPAYAALVKELSPSLSLPAASTSFNQLYRVYTVRVVMPRELRDVGQMLAVLRAVLGRLLGEIFLREEVFSREAYREDITQDGSPSIGMEEKIQLLAETPHRTRALDVMLEAFAREINLHYKRQPDAVRKAFFQSAAEALERQRLTPMRSEVIEATFADFQAKLEAGLEAALSAAVEEVEEKNKQLNFLPPDELPDYARLRASNSLHYLRSARLRLGFLVEHLSALVEAFANLDQGQPPTPLLEEQLDGVLLELRTQNLVRPYLIEGARLSPELEQQKAAFPFQVHALVERMAAVDDPAREFKRLTKRIQNSLYQRLYHAILICQGWIKSHHQGQGEGFRATEGFTTLKGQAANFKFRVPMLRALYLKIGVIQELAETRQSGQGAVGTSKRFPTVDFTKSWGLIIPHAVLVESIVARGGLRGFDPDTYWANVDKGLAQQAQKGQGVQRLALTLREIYKQSPEEGLAVFPELLQNPPGTLRYVINQALHPPAKFQAMTPQEQMAQPAAWAETLLGALAARRANTILPGDAP